MEILLTEPSAVLKTANKYVTDDIIVIVDESLLSTIKELVFTKDYPITIDSQSITTYAIEIDDELYSYFHNKLYTIPPMLKFSANTGSEVVTSHSVNLNDETTDNFNYVVLLSTIMAYQLWYFLYFDIVESDSKKYLVLNQIQDSSGYTITADALAGIEYISLIIS